MAEARCRSTNGLKFDATEPPRLQRQGALEHCGKYWKHSCCNATHNLPLKRLVLEPLVANVNRRCQSLSEELTCSACHPLVGVGAIDRVCLDLCDDWFDACKDEFYMAEHHRLAPCYGNALVCSPLKDIVTTGAAFCRHMGYTPGKATDAEGKDCFDGSVPDTYGEPEPAEKVSDALFRIFQEQSSEPTEFVLVVILGTILSLFLSIKFFKRWHHAHQEMNREAARRRQQEAYRASYHLGKAADTGATSDASDSDSDSDADDSPGRGPPGDAHIMDETPTHVE
ncbi:hypothetical protein SPRG_04215 [Saprolegnia parasitica CBS 223.65]|uniref:Folate receptor-like domain-containing protein n=1 Tax=Saprolegnia parasitica (strain CBS 223.65) TaxID=695850 RepID=A0A067CKG8_SAPPC|nr:hypothetical protein SPRG_04215 [Saprolegnia parasitica CBS 223.65]KDO31028.1 hypothetical protein SPRG_04215 [Saprolegnia parasitica CBS 223.65]|eukprot:XP_012198205.1 hypothetical protein SPRG_04215 [Saprolegnia parasitica CBS 223.65]